VLNNPLIGILDFLIYLLEDVRERGGAGTVHKPDSVPSTIIKITQGPPPT